MEAGTELEQRRDLALGVDDALVGAKDPGHALQQGALARPIFADEPERAPFRDRERDIAKRPQLLVASPPTSHRGGLEGVVPLVVQAIPLRDTVDGDRRAAHTSSATRPSSREKTHHPSTSAPKAQSTKYVKSQSGGNRRSYSAAR